MSEPVVKTIKYRFLRASAARWVTVNPVLGPAEPGYEIDTNRLKLGDGVTRWNDLEYLVDTAAINALAELAVAEALDELEVPTTASITAQINAAIATLDAPTSLEMTNAISSALTASGHVTSTQVSAQISAALSTLDIPTDSEIAAAIAAAVSALSIADVDGLQAALDAKADGATVLLLENGAAVPPGTPAGTLIFEKSA